MSENIKIAFSFDHNYYRQCGVAIASLLDCSDEKNNYDIYCLHDDSVTLGDKNDITNIVRSKSKNSNVFFIAVDNVFDDSFEIRGITKAAYFRLLLHKLLPDIRKIIYSDVDVLFRDSLRDVYSIDIGDSLLGAVKATAINLQEMFEKLQVEHEYWEKHLSNTKGKYINSGFLIMNLDKIRETNIGNRWIEMSKDSFFFLDQDILNITCKNRIYYLPARYNIITYAVGSIYEKLVSEKVLGIEEVNDVYLKPVVFHWAGEKPWDNKKLIYADEWWKFVEHKTNFFDYFTERYNNLDQNNDKRKG